MSLITNGWYQVFYVLKGRKTGLFFYIWRVNLKWYISFMVCALTLLGVTNERSVLPNQEIVLHFENGSDATHEAEEALRSIREKLRHIGVSDLQVTATMDGSVRITYYSNADVAAVKALLNQDQTFAVDHTAFEATSPIDVPENGSDQDYEFNVSEISTQSENGLGFNGILLDQKSVHDRYTYPIVYLGTGNASYSRLQKQVAARVACYSDTTIRTDRASYQIPEVRAGPIA
ncbi:MAG: hypothetical protein R3359_09400 [Marinirhabdus sp.]|nr:hypothetical protein [Marinirhabdus sp.]